MTRYLLDTNIISNVVMLEPSDLLLAWMGRQDDADLFISTLTIAEICRGILEKPAGRKRNVLSQWFAGPQGPQALFKGRILAFDEQAGLVWAQLMAQGREAGRPRNALDMVIAAIAHAHDCVMVTDNERDFWGIELINPMREG